MFFFGNKKTQKNTQKKSPKKPRSNTFILEEIISPSAYCPVPIDDSIVNYSIFELFTEEELITAILGTKEPPNITDINTESLVQHYWEEIKKYFQENPTEADSFNLEDLSTWPTLDALINPEAPTVEIPDVGGAVDTLPPPTIVPIDPPRKNPDSGGQEPIIDNSPQPPTLVNAISDLTLTPEISSQTIDISRVFATPNGEQLKYEVISDNGEFLNINLENNQLSIEAIPKTGESQITIRGTTESGGVAAHTFKVFNNYVTPESVATINSGLTELQKVIDANQDDLLASLDTLEAQTALETLGTELESNFDNILNAIQQPETLVRAGVSPEAVATLEKLLASEAVGEALGLPTSMESALANEDFRIWDNYLINATEAASILLPDAPQTTVGFLDFAGEHGENVRAVFESVNPNAEYKRLSVNDGNWAEQLVQYVDNLKAAGEERGIANLSFDLTQVDDQGRVTTRYDLTEGEQLAIQYARDNNVLLVAASGNTGGEMSALGKAASKFDNIITVGAVNKLEEVADYSSRGDTLTLVAPGGQYENDPDAFVGTSRATSYVTGAASLVWAANPDLSYQQVKELLTLTAKDLGPEGWDAETGAGLLDVTEAVMMAGLVAPETVVNSGDVEILPFSGAGRVSADVRAASPETEAAIQDLTDTENELLSQWQVLRDLGNPDTTLEELQNEIAKRQAAALDSYQVVDVAAAKSLAKNEQLLEALRLAMGHHDIESGRLQVLEGRQQELQNGLTALTGERDELVVANEEQLKVLEEAIARTEKELDNARKKLKYQLVDPDTLVAQTDAVKAEIAGLETKIKEYRLQSAALKAQADHFYVQANQYRQQQQHHTNIANNAWRTRRGRSGRRYTERNTPVYNHHMNIANQAGRNASEATAKGDVLQANHNQVQQLTAQMEQQNRELKDYEKLLGSNNQELSKLTGDNDDAQKILEALQRQAGAKTKQAEQYWQQAELAEKRRVESQDKANWHNSMINRWEVVGRRKSGKKHKRVYGWRHYPEHIAPRDEAQKQAKNAEAERQTFEQWGHQAQLEANELNKQATALSERLTDWPELKRGIEYEINAKEQQLQAEKDLVALQTPVQQQQLETMELKISQSEAELAKLEAEELSEQKQRTDATQERLNKVQGEVEVNWGESAMATKDLQDFLETYGYLLPYQERRAAVQKQIRQLEIEKAETQELLLEIRNAIASDPNNSNLASQLEPTENHLQDIEQRLAYAKAQEEQLNLSAPDSPQRLAIGNLIANLEERLQRSPDTNTLPLPKYIDFLRGVESRSNNLLNGFDDLEERLKVAETEQTAADETLKRLQDEYRDLGLAKADIEAEKPAVEEAINLKDAEIINTKTEIRQAQDTIKSLESNLAATKQTKSDKEAEIVGQEGAIAQTESNIAAMPGKIAAKQAEITEQQSVLQGYNNQINEANAVTNNFEQQRLQHEANANSWNNKINTWGITGYRTETYRYKSGKRWKTGYRQVPVYGWLNNPQAETNRNAELATANNAAQQRDLAAQQAQELSNALQPQIQVTTTNIGQLQTDKQNLEAEQRNLQTQLGNQQQGLQNLQSELVGIEQSIGNIESDLAANEQKVEELDAKLLKQSSDKIYLEETLAEIEGRIADKESEISDKYEEIELTEKYARQVGAEIDRLSNRVNLLNEGDELETKYREQEEDWKEAIATQVAATEALLAARKSGEEERRQLLSLQSELAETQTNLATAKQQQETLTNAVADTQQDLDFRQLQLGNQQLQLQSLQGQDQPLQSAETHYYNLAQQNRRRIWYSNGRQLVYNAQAAAAYRANMELAARMAQERNELWPKIEETQKKIEELQEDIATKQTDLGSQQSKLGTATTKIANLTAKVGQIEADIPPLITALEPLQQQEANKLQEFQTAVQTAETIGQQLTTTTRKQGEALNRLIGFGVLATESDLDFFTTQVRDKVKGFIDDLENRSSELGAEADKLTGLIADWQSDLDKTTDDVSRQALTNLIAQTTAQRDDLSIRKAENEGVVFGLNARLTEATASLGNLRQQQELEIREQLDSNDERLEALNRHLGTEAAAEKAVSEDTVLAYAQLNEQVRADLTASATQWVNQLLEGHQQTKEIGESQQNLSQSVDDLTQYIEDNLADIDGERDRNLADLRDAITTLGVVAPRRDEFAAGESTLKQEIEKLKQLIEQDAKLWSEIAPIVERFGVESQELAEYQQQYDAKKQQDETAAQQYEQKRQQHENNANHWQSQIKTWGVVGHRRRNRKTVPVYGWIHNSAAEANYNNERAAAETAAKNRDAALELPTAKAYREEFVNNATSNATAIDVLQAETEEKSNEYSSLLAQVKAEEAHNNAQASAALAQADWYEKRAAEHWQRSRKNGPTWTERRKTWKRGKSGKKKTHWVTITHVDHDWILWDTYSKLAPQVRQQAAEQLVVSDEKSRQQERFQPLAEQWANTQNATNVAEAPIDASHNLAEVLETSREHIPAAQEQLQLLENLLPEIEQEFAKAQKEADDYNAKVLAEWEEHDENAVEYIDTVEEILERRGALNKQSQELQNKLADTEKWVEQQTMALDTETEQVDKLRQQLIADVEALAEKIAVATGEELTELQTKQAQLQDALGLVENKAVVLREQQTAFSQKRTLLTAENEVILAEQGLLDAYLITPESDFEELQQQLADARAALAEAQRLAEKAEASSQALTAPLQELQADLLAQNDEHLKAAKDRQEILKDLLEATELNANYTLDAAKKQKEVNDLEFQVLQRLQEATIAGNEEAKHLLDVATQNDMATVAEIYYRDYSDVASDKRSSSAGGVGRHSDRILADKYYREMQNHRQLQRLAQQQANHFGEIRRTAEAHLEELQKQQEDAAKTLQDINDEINRNQEQQEAKEQELAVVQARLDGIARIREQTEQTFVQLVSLERLNLAQAQLEQEIAQRRQSEIDEAVADRLEREEIEIERQRLEARAKLEQLEQLQAEDELQQAVNQVRADVGLDAVAGGSDSDKLSSNMATLLGQLQDLEKQVPDLPDDVKALLADAKGEIHSALQGKEAENIEKNLLKVSEGLMEQINQHQAAIAQIELEEQQDAVLLQQAENNLQGATRKLLEEALTFQSLGAERELLTPLNLETLQKVAYAEQAVEISQELAQESRDLLNRIIKQRKEERKARKKSFLNELLGMLIQVFEIVATILDFTGIGAPIAAALRAASMIFQVILAAYNGNWDLLKRMVANQIFGSIGGSIFMNVIEGNWEAVGETILLEAAKAAAAYFGVDPSIVDSAYGAYKAYEAGDSKLALAYAIQAVAGAVGDATGIVDRKAEGAFSFVAKFVLTVAENAVEVHNGVQAYEDGRLFEVLQSLFVVGSDLYNNFQQEIKEAFAPDEDSEGDSSGTGEEEPPNPDSAGEGGDLVPSGSTCNN